MADAAARTLTFALRGRLGREELPALSDAVGGRLAACCPARVVLDLEGLRADAVALEGLALIALRARRAGCAISVRGCSPELREMIELAGFGELF